MCVNHKHLNSILDNDIKTHYNVINRQKVRQKMKKVYITKKTEEKRLKDFQEIAENWDELPEYAKGKIDGIICTIMAFLEAESANKKQK